jgi:hypothetical protein
MRYLYLSILFLFLFSCRSESNKTIEPSSDKDPRMTYLKSPSGTNSSLPRLYSNGEELYMSWVETLDSMNVLKYAVYSNDQWNVPEAIISGSDWFVNWADFPSLTENNENLLTSFLQKSADSTYTYDIKLNLYSKETDSWKKDFILHDDGTKSEHGFVSMLPWKEDQFFVTWLDGRNTVGGHTDHDTHSVKGGGMTIRGAFLNRDGDKLMDIELDALTCDCCQTSAALITNGILVAYRDRSNEEIRDIAVVRYDTVKGWSRPMLIGNDHWKIPGCPVNGPSIDAIQDDVVIAWFTAANDNPSVNVAFSEDGGISFGMATRIDHGNAIGRVDVVMIDESNALIIWLEPNGDDVLIQLMEVSSDGVMGEAITISKTSAERASGFPQLEVLNGKAYIAWTSIEDEEPQIKLVSVNL